MSRLLPSSLFAALLVFGASLPARADDAKHTYSGEITGVVCSACKQDVETSLTKNLAGVLKILVEPSGKPDVQKLTIVTTSNTITAAAANQALGADAKDFHILSLSEKK